MVLKKIKKVVHKLSSTCNPCKIFDLVSNDPISKNALIILLTLGMAAAAGFLFIIIAAKLYTIESLGIATLLLSYASIVIIITRFGNEQSMIWYYDETQKSSIYFSFFFITTSSAIIFSLLLILMSYFGVLGTDYLFTYSAVFLVGVIILSISQVSGGFFLASGKPILYFLQNTVISSRFIILLFLIPFGVLGIFGSLVIASGLSSIFAVLLLYHYGIRFQLPEKKILNISYHYSMRNYISDCLFTIPTFLIPIVVFFISGQKDTAIYSVSYAFASITFIIPISIGYALFMSGCQEKTTIPSLKFVISAALMLLMGITLIFFFWGNDIINVLGPDYSGSGELIVIIMSSSIFALFFQIYSSKFKIFQEMNKLLMLNGVFFVILMSLSCLFVLNMGLIGAGYAWVATYAICVVPMVFYTLLNKKYMHNDLLRPQA